MGKSYYIIYETKNLKNNKIYIGMHETDNLEDGYLGSGTRLKRAIKYYGKEFFKRKVLFSFDNREEMINKEIELVNEEFINRKDTYNLTIGGKPNWNNHLNLTVKEISRLGRLKANQTLVKRLKDDKEYNKYFSDKVSKGVKQFYKNGGKPSFEGKTHSDKTKKQMSETKKRNKSQQGSKNSQYGKMWIYNELIKESKMVLSIDPIPDGWEKGRKMVFKR